MQGPNLTFSHLAREAENKAEDEAEDEAEDKAEVERASIGRKFHNYHYYYFLGGFEFYGNKLSLNE